MISRMSSRTCPPVAFSNCRIINTTHTIPSSLSQAFQLVLTLLSLFRVIGNRPWIMDIIAPVISNTLVSQMSTMSTTTATSFSRDSDQRTSHFLSISTGVTYCLISYLAVPLSVCFLLYVRQVQYLFERLFSSGIDVNQEGVESV